MLFGGSFYIYLLDLVYIFSSICIFEFSFEFSGLALLKLWLGWELTSISIISWLSDCLACWTIAIFFESKFFSLSPKNLVPWVFFRLQRNSNAYLLTGSDPSSVNFTIFSIKVLSVFIIFCYLLEAKLARNLIAWSFIIGALSSREAFISSIKSSIPRVNNKLFKVYWAASTMVAFASLSLLKMYGEMFLATL